LAEASVVCGWGETCVSPGRREAEQLPMLTVNWSGREADKPSQRLTTERLREVEKM
jgi:hypothetical protein